MHVFRRVSPVVVAACVQVPLLAIIFLGDFGFYFPGSLGDLRYLVRWGLLYAAVLAVGIFLACIEGRLLLAAVQFAAPFVLSTVWWIVMMTAVR